MGIISNMQRAHAGQIRSPRRTQAAARLHHQARHDAERMMLTAQCPTTAGQQERRRLEAKAQAAAMAADNAGLLSRIEELFCIQELEAQLDATPTVDDRIDLARLKKSVIHPASELD